MAETPGALPPGAELLVPEGEVTRAYEQMAARLQPVIDTEDCVLLGILVGGMLPLVAVASRLQGDFLLDYCHVTRYDGAQQGGELRWLQAPRVPLSGRTAIIVDDIYDEGVTLDYVADACRELGAARVMGTVLVAKQHGRATGRQAPEVIGLQVPDRYVFGCGMDLDHRWRHLPGIYALAEDP